MRNISYDISAGLTQEVMEKVRAQHPSIKDTMSEDGLYDWILNHTHKMVLEMIAELDARGLTTDLE